MVYIQIYSFFNNILALIGRIILFLANSFLHIILRMRDGKTIWKDLVGRTMAQIA